VDIERPGIDVPNGVGTIRALKSWHGTITPDQLFRGIPNTRARCESASTLTAQHEGGSLIPRI